MVVSNPFNLEVSSKMLQNSFIGREVYLRVMGGAWQRVPRRLACPLAADGAIASMKQLITTHKSELETYTDLDLTAIDRITYLHDFDREVQYGFARVGRGAARRGCG